jgi:carbon storage regulator
MLILEREKNQSILIGDSIRILITNIERDSIEIGIEAPQDIQILIDRSHKDRNKA